MAPPLLRRVALVLLVALAPLALDGCVSIGVSRADLSAPPEPSAPPDGRRDRRRLREARGPRGRPPCRLSGPVRAPAAGQGRDARRALDGHDVDREGPAAGPLPPARHEAHRRRRQRRRPRQSGRQDVRGRRRRAHGRDGRPEEGARRLDRPRRADARRDRRPRDHRHRQGHASQASPASAAAARRDRDPRSARAVARAGPRRPRRRPSTSSRPRAPSSRRSASP